MSRVMGPSLVVWTITHHGPHGEEGDGKRASGVTDNKGRWILILEVRRKIL